MQDGILEKVRVILSKGYVCDHCLGRPLAQLLSGMSNEERGKALRLVFAMAVDAGLIKSDSVDFSNFTNIEFHLNKSTTKQKSNESKCYFCGNLFDKLDEMATNVANELELYEFSTFHLGVKLNEWIENREIELWEEIGAEYAESIRNELTREVGKRVQEMMGKSVEFKNPDVVAVLNLERNVIEVEVRSVFIYGRYNKYKEMPQARWVCRHCDGVGCKRCDWKGRLYEDSVQDRIGDVLVEMFDGVDTSFHGAGREDIDALCTGWREFVIEIKEPRKRNVDLKKAEKEINKRNKGIIEVKDLKFVDKEFVRLLKSKRTKKTYNVLVKVLEGSVDESKLKELVNKSFLLSQRTPKRVAHRRSDKIRKRKITVLSYKLVDDEHFEIDVEAEAGTYIKEFISGDEGRTKPSLSSLLGVKLITEKLIVTGFKDE